MAELLNQYRVLVLNRLWQAVNICGVKRALSLLYCGHARVVHEERGEFQTFGFWEWCSYSSRYSGPDLLHGVRLNLRAPRVILLTFYDRYPIREVRLTRQNVFERDNCTCQYCGRRFDRRYLNIDHVIPRDRGGRTVWTNVVCSCHECNRRKGNRTPEEAGMRLIRPPTRPRQRPLLISASGSFDRAWHHFIDVRRWQVNMGR
ncbi:MAG TPA: HNH endonuclease [Lentisphaerae bacterium]|nr:HNH endonuclease [Lentisphaerota bacterium]